VAGGVTRIAIFQSQTGIDPAANAGALVSAIDEAAAGGAEMLFTPEMSGLLDRDAQRARQSVRATEEDQALAACRDAAACNGLWLHLGSLAVTAEDGKFANRGFVIDSSGEIRASYDKIHLFDVDLPTGESWRESNVYRGGSEAVVVEGTPVGKLGLTICYDLRFPALFQRLTDAGAEVVSVPAAFTVPTGKAHWEILLRARAIEAGVFVVAAAQCGHHEDGRDTYGHSLLVDPWGTILVDMGEKVGVSFGEVDVAKVAEVRSRVPAIDHRRAVGEPVVR
jgi:predicted amidohydrolase